MSWRKSTSGSTTRPSKRHDAQDIHAPPEDYVVKKLWHDKAWAEYSEWQTRDKKTLKRINLILKSIERDGYGCIGKPEPLKGNLAGKWSVRIDAANRLIFSIEDGILEVYSCMGHYE